MPSKETRERILNHAERLFALRGFHGTSLREVAKASGVRQSLVQYHYDSKEALFRAVFERRILPMNHGRMSRLDAIQQQAGSRKRRDPEDVVRALVEPFVLLARHGRGGAELYPQLIAQIINDPQDHARRISREFNDPVARATIRSLDAALPDLGDDRLPWCYVFAVGAMVSSVAGTGRVEALSNGHCDGDDVEHIVELLVPFIVGGMRAVAGGVKRRSRGGSSKARVPKRVARNSSMA
jgi:AcrR family transcriptional regulator